MKNTKKRGFTIVELVIVIAVIAILASVLIPTFANVVANAKKTKLLQDARTAYTTVLAEKVEGGIDSSVSGTYGGWTVTFKNNTSYDADVVSNAIDGKIYTFTVTNGEFSKTPTESNAPAGGGTGNQGGNQGTGGENSNVQG